MLERDAEALRGRRDERGVLEAWPDDLDRADARVAIGDLEDHRTAVVVVSAVVIVCCRHQVPVIAL